MWRGIARSAAGTSSQLVEHQLGTECDNKQRPLAQPRTINKDVVETHGANVGANFDDELFKEGRAKVHLTRRQKWEE